jgi:hypothetical protein
MPKIYAEFSRRKHNKGNLTTFSRIGAEEVQTVAVESWNHEQMNLFWQQLLQ